MAKTTGTVTVKRSRNGTTIRATGSAAQALFDAMCRSVERTVGMPEPPAPDAATSPNPVSQPTHQQ
jgi:hypothetical protein